MSDISYSAELSGAGLKQTKARKAILQILAEEDRPLDVLEILDSLRSQDVEADQATVYRILDVFHKKDLVTRFEFQEGKFRYELKGAEHHHLICSKCGGIEDIADCAIERLEEDILKKKGFQVKQHSLEFYGVCKNCLR